MRASRQSGPEGGGPNSIGSPTPLRGGQSPAKGPWAVLSHLNELARGMPEINLGPARVRNHWGVESAGGGM
jgi:hypothetical protein